MLRSLQNKCLVASKIVVLIAVRDKHIELLNNRSAPRLGFKDHPPNFENLVWFLDEMKKDLGSSSSQNSIGASVAGGNKRSLEDEGAIIEEILQKLKSHSNCQNAYFVDAANAFKVISIDKSEKRFTVKGRNKKKVKAIEGPEMDSWAMLGDCFSAAGEEALEFMNGPAGWPVHQPRWKSLQFLRSALAAPWTTLCLERPSGHEAPGGFDVIREVLEVPVLGVTLV